MARLARVDIGNEIYHIINRANGRLQIFDSPSDYQLFEQLILEAQELTDVRVIAYVLMPNHWHLVLWPRKDGDLARFMHRLCNTHTRRVHTSTGTVGSGHLYQGRYKSFLVETDSYLLSLIKYVERNPVRARLAKQCEDWQWGSAWRRVHGTEQQKKLLCISPTDIPSDYLQWINIDDKPEELERMRVCVNKGMPYGRDTWVGAMVAKYDLEHTQRGAGRPKKN